MFKKLFISCLFDWLTTLCFVNDVTHGVTVMIRWRKINTHNAYILKNPTLCLCFSLFFIAFNSLTAPYTLHMIFRVCLLAYISKWNIHLIFIQERKKNILLKINCSAKMKYMFLSLEIIKKKNRSKEKQFSKEWRICQPISCMNLPQSFVIFTDIRKHFSLWNPNRSVHFRRMVRISV